MMTVKHILPTGEEFVYPTTHVNFVPVPTKHGSPPPPTGSVWRYDDEGRSYEMSEGFVYVMNNLGKTVARYALETETPKG